MMWYAAPHPRGWRAMSASNLHVTGLVAGDRQVPRRRFEGTYLFGYRRDYTDGPQNRETIAFRKQHNTDIWLPGRPPGVYPLARST